MAGVWRPLRFRSRAPPGSRSGSGHLRQVGLATRPAQAPGGPLAWRAWRGGRAASVTRPQARGSAGAASVRPTLGRDPAFGTLRRLGRSLGAWKEARLVAADPRSGSAAPPDPPQVPRWARGRSSGLGGRTWDSGTQPGWPVDASSYRTHRDLQGPGSLPEAGPARVCEQPLDGSGPGDPLHWAVGPGRPRRPEPPLGAPSAAVQCTAEGGGSAGVIWVCGVE